jgi:hypothetical protein
VWFHWWLNGEGARPAGRWGRSAGRGRRIIPSPMSGVLTQVDQ